MNEDLADVSCPIREGARSFPDRIAVRVGNARVTYLELDRRIVACEASLVSSGLCRSDRATVFAANGLAALVALFSLFRLGAIACVLNTRIPSEVLASQVDLLRPTIHLTTGDQITLRSGVRRFALDEIESYPTDGPADGDYPSPNSDENTSARWRLSDPATVVFTSGSTGLAKAVLHTHGNHYFSAIGSSTIIPLKEGDTWMTSLPFFHVGGLAILFRSFMAGAAIMLVEPREAAEVLSLAGVTHASLVQAQLKRWLDLGGSKGPDLKVVLLGGSSISPALIRAAGQRQLPMRLSYGSSEMASQVATTTSPPNIPSDGLCGPVLPYRQVRIGDGGVISVRGRTRFEGYVERDDLGRPFDEDGWFETSDLGRFVGDELQVTGRVDNMFISGGENIHPEPVELILSEVQGVQEVVVVPVVDEEYGRRPVAVIDGDWGQIDESELKARVASVLPSYMVPVHFLTWPSGLVSDGVSKVDRILIREYAEMRLKGVL